MTEYDYKKICLKLLEELPQRQKTVVVRRFGLENKEKETLEKIGRDFGVTRERVRQIEADGFRELEKKKEERDLKKTLLHLRQYLQGKGGLKRENIMLVELGKDDFQNYVSFFLTLEDDFHHFPEDKDFYSFWTIEKNLFQKVKNISESLVKKFEKEQSPLSEDDFFKLGKNESPQVFLSSVEILKRIEKGLLGRFGLVDWPEIKPHGVKDRAYLSLRKTGKPLHFREVAHLSSELEGECCRRKSVFPQTVHNELIRDERFVLVGRGIYALKEWGYNPGTVKDIIVDILKKSKKPLTKEQIFNQVLNQRMVKENTILLNLQNKSLFSRDSQGRYILK